MVACRPLSAGEAGRSPLLIRWKRHHPLPQAFWSRTRRTTLKRGVLAGWRLSGGGNASGINFGAEHFTKPTKQHDVSQSVAMGKNGTSCWLVPADGCVLSEVATKTTSKRC